ncbi:MAG: class I SAM-dependent methyltransferase [Sphingomonadales bacterium]
MESIGDEIKKRNRFEFGKNWKRFLRDLNQDRIDRAVYSLQNMLDAERLDGKTFLDIGSGSGLFSLAARKLGANVHSFDYDPQSVSCTKELRARFGGDGGDWIIEEGSALDEGYLRSLGSFDVVYSWGVLHHTGNMRKAIDLATERVKPGGRLFIAIYNDQGWISRYWFYVKMLWNKAPWLRWLIILVHAPTHFVGRFIYRWLKRSGELRRGMSLWHDLIDWLGGFPFETATTSFVVEYVESLGFEIKKYNSCGNRHGCNEYLFYKLS